MPRALDVTTSWLGSVLRFGAGYVASSIGPRPAEPLELFEFEACPFCRKVREALSMLDLPARIHPCPKNGPTYRPQVIREGGKRQFPWLRDPNTGVAMYESTEIVAYLYRHYGTRTAPWWLRSHVSMPMGSLVSLLRAGRGSRYVPARSPAQPLELWSFEASPYCRIVRETLSELELPYLLHNVAKASPSRAAFVQRSGKMMVPWLHDPNTGVEMFESAKIRDYLVQTYAEH
jgi:glutathione S-transferase